MKEKGNGKGKGKGKRGDGKKTKGVCVTDSKKDMEGAMTCVRAGYRFLARHDHHRFTILTSPHWRAKQSQAIPSNPR